MIPAVAQTLARILANGTSLLSTEQIDFNPPNSCLAGRAALTVYCYNIQECDFPGEQSSFANAPVQLKPASVRWFELAFLITAWDFTALGEQQLLSEALNSLLCREWFESDRLASELSLGERRMFKIASTETVDPIQLWRSLNLPLRPALYITVTAPLCFSVAPSFQSRAIEAVER
jgi:Pvc16 N-terminal domain